MGKRTEVRLTLSSEAMEKRLDRLREKSGLSSRLDVFNHAFFIMEVVVNEIVSGRSICSLDKENNRLKELVFAELPCQKINDADKPTKH